MAFVNYMLLLVVVCIYEWFWFIYDNFVSICVCNVFFNRIYCCISRNSSSHLQISHGRTSSLIFTSNFISFSNCADSVSRSVLNNSFNSKHPFPVWMNNKWRQRCYYVKDCWKIPSSSKCKLIFQCFNNMIHPQKLH